MDNLNLLPSKNAIRETYESYKPVLQEIMEKVEDKLRKTIHLASNPTYKSRVKSFKSYYRKVLRLKAEEAEKSNFVPLTDMMGIRVICAFLEDLSEVERQVKENFDVKEVEYKGAQQSFREFGYESVHVLIAIPNDCFPTVNVKPLPESIVCEIQIRTILQDAWAEVEHELVYKSEFTPFDMPLRRKLASMNASLSLADIIFQEIRDYQKKLQGEVEARRASFYEKADELTMNVSFKDAALGEQKNIHRVSPYVRGTIDDMLLDAIHAHNHGDLTRAVQIYTEILNSQPQPAAPVMSVIHKHRGMAFFAKSEYSNALQDFLDSVKFDPASFRSYYYIGIVYGIMNENQKAIDAFTKSIDINQYQSHARFRRAVSYYNIGDYNRSRIDLDAAIALGLDGDECKYLNDKLVEKFGMKM
ncbi:RelA/SpoT domain-containing protein [Treponema zioleckii]|uniref:RelA/SpoT domain-containing protein n=1 Tax=Treponema zioleckii TaxID=331680 RepID=UPI00168AE823|nr:RelA/SpoT domain-containing protein [Treponema zioleckii]